MSECSGVPGASTHRLGTSRPASPRKAQWENLDALLEDLPPGMPFLAPDDAGNFEKYTHRPVKVYAPGDGWKNCARALEKYDAELCKGYREEIDTLLVFAGLFSAVVTAFTIESYQWLKADSNDAIVVLLSQIAQSVGPNSTTAPLFQASTGLPGTVSVRINVYWFLALALSLSAALVAILCKQWVREFERNPGLTPKEFVAVHQTKFEGLEKWKVGGIISLLPLLLQLALAMFALGVLELLWQLHLVVAVVVCVPTLVAFVFYAATTVLPAVSFSGDRSTECPYKSPQAKLAFPVYDFCLWMGKALASARHYPAYLLSVLHYHISTRFLAQHDLPHPFFGDRAAGWLELRVPAWPDLSFGFTERLDRRVPPQRPLSLFRSLRWMHVNLDDGDVPEWIWRCLWDTAPRFAGDEGALKRGFCYVECGSTDSDLDGGIERCGLRALALAYLLRTHAPQKFLVEAYVRNLGTLDVASAEYLTSRLRWRLSSTPIDAQAAATLMITACAFVRTHIDEPLGPFLLSLARLSSHVADLALRRVFLGCTVMLYHAALPPSEISDEMVWEQCYFLWDDDEEDYCRHPERLRLRPGVGELAQIVEAFARGCEDPVAALAERMDADYAEEMRPIVRELLDIARQGAVPPASASGASGAEYGPALVDSPAPLTDEEEHSHTEWRAVPLAPPSDRAAAPGDSVWHGGASSGQDAPILRAVVVHTPSGADKARSRTDGEGTRLSATERGRAAGIRAHAQTPPAHRDDEGARPPHGEWGEGRSGQ